MNLCLSAEITQIYADRKFSKFRSHDRRLEKPHCPDRRRTRLSDIINGIKVDLYELIEIWRYYIENLIAALVVDVGFFGSEGAVFLQSRAPGVR